jgi:hypothetical protein
VFLLQAAIFDEIDLRDASVAECSVRGSDYLGFQVTSCSLCASECTPLVSRRGVLSHASRILSSQAKQCLPKSFYAICNDVGLLLLLTARPAGRPAFIVLAACAPLAQQCAAFNTISAHFCTRSAATAALQGRLLSVRHFDFSTRRLHIEKELCSVHKPESKI